MKVYEDLKPVFNLSQPVALTIGNFDGMHLGHRSVISHLVSMGKKQNIPSAVITFKNHPSSILRPNHPIPLLTSYHQKLALLEDQNVDIVIALEFTFPFSEQSADEFLLRVKEVLPFRHLILGYDAKLGNDRQGNTPLLHDLANRHHFMLEFLPPVLIDNEPVSSSRIRKAIETEDLKKAEKLLGRKYSIVGQVFKSQGIGKQMGYPTANIDVTGLCHPIFGVYFVKVKTKDGIFPAVANLGFAPTTRHDHLPILEAHILQGSPNLYNERIEVIFEDYVRMEKVFGTLDELKNQISEDVAAAKAYFHL